MSAASIATDVREENAMRTLAAASCGMDDRHAVSLFVYQFSDNRRGEYNSRLSRVARQRRERGMKDSQVMTACRYLMDNINDYIVGLADTDDVPEFINCTTNALHLSVIRCAHDEGPYTLAETWQIEE
jgi:hypothetical protein